MVVSGVFTDITSKLDNLGIKAVNHIATYETLCIP